MQNSINFEQAQALVENMKKMLKVQNAEKRMLRITTDCIGPVSYFWMADVVKKLAACRNIRYWEYLSENQLEALAYIQPEIAREGEKHITLPIPDVRIVNSFIGFISSVCAENRLVIEIRNVECMDENSRMVCKYLVNDHIANLILENYT